MMMPANYSALDAAEMTYTVGGSGLATLGGNIWTIVGNSYVMTVTNKVLGSMFSGAYKFGDATKGIWHIITGGAGVGSQGKYAATKLGAIGQGVGIVAAVSQLMSYDVIAFAPEAGSDDYIDGYSNYDSALIAVSGNTDFASGAGSKNKTYSGAGSKNKDYVGSNVLDTFGWF